MTIDTETIRDAAEVLDTLTSTLAVDHPLRTRATARAKSCVSGLYSAADALDAQAAQLAAYPADWRVDSSLETWFPLTAEQLKAETAEIAEAKGQIERLDRQNAGLRTQHDRDSKTLREYAQARDGLRRACAALEAEKARLRYALRWTAAALQEACRRPTIITEKDQWRIDHETHTTGEILASADAALSGESHD